MPRLNPGVLTCSVHSSVFFPHEHSCSAIKGRELWEFNPNLWSRLSRHANSDLKVMDLPQSWSSKFYESSAKRSTVDEAPAPGSSFRKGPKRRMPGAGRAVKLQRLVICLRIWARKTIKKHDQHVMKIQFVHICFPMKHGDFGVALAQTQPLLPEDRMDPVSENHQ